MVTCFLRYVIDPAKLKEFEHYGKLWIPLVEKFSGKHHGYFLPSEDVNNIALSLFSIPGLAEYEQYRQKSFTIQRVWLLSTMQKKPDASSVMNARSSGRFSVSDMTFDQAPKSVRPSTQHLCA